MRISQEKIDQNYILQCMTEVRILNKTNVLKHFFDMFHKSFVKHFFRLKKQFCSSFSELGF